MSVETATYLSQLDITKPTATDPKSEGDDHIRLLKSTNKNTFPNFTAAPLLATQAQLDKLVTSVALNPSTPANAIFVDATGNVMIGSTVPGLQAPGRGYLEIAGSSTAMTAYRSAGNMTGYTSGFTTGIEIYGSTDIVFTAGVNTCQRMNDTGAVFFPSIGTTASAANAFLNSGSSPVNQLLRSTSSLRYKTDVRDLPKSYLTDVLKLRPVVYKSNAEADDQSLDWVGLIAEEVAAVAPRLVHYTTLQEGGPLVPDGVQYDRLAVLLLAVVKKQAVSISNLEQRVLALEAK
jgi:hypothetical protein